MKPIDLNKVQPDPIAAALRKADKDVIKVTGYVCDANETSISISKSRESSSSVEYPRSAIHGALFDEESGRTTLLVDPDARVRYTSSGTASMIIARDNAAGSQCGASCSSEDGRVTCCCGVGQKCKSEWGDCKCLDATPPTPTGPGAHVPPNFGETIGGYFEGARGFAAQQRGPISLPWSCRSERGRCPVICTPIIIDGKFYGWDCYCDCTYPIPDPPRTRY